MAINFLNSIESITLPGTTTDYYIGGSGGGVASNALKIGSRTTGNTIAMELFHATNPVSLGISYSGGDALAFIDSVHSSFDSVLQFKTGGDERFRVGALNANTFQIKPAAAGNDVAITDNSGNAILYSDTSTQRIGIGTTSPQTTLHLYDTGGSILRLGSDQHGDTNKIEFDATNTGSIFHSITSNTNTGNLQIRAGDGGGGHEVNIYTDGLFAATFDNNQRLGIGTTSPSTSLHVKSTSAGSGYMTIENTVHYSKLDLKSTTYTGSIVMDGTGGYISGGGLILDSGTNIRTQFLQGGVAKMIINNGNVGIGTTNPPYKLTVAGDTYVNNANLHINSGYGIVNAANISHKIGFPSLGNFAFENVNVGIGTTSPSAALEVVGGIKLSDNSPLTWATSNTRIFGQSGYMQLQVASIDVMRLASSGNVGIGTTSPEQRLHISSSGSTLMRITGGGSSIAGIDFGDSTNTDDGRIRYDNSSRYMQFVVADSERMRITSAGDTGIGVTTPRAKLDVAGGIKVADDTDTAGANKVGTLRYRYVPGSPKNYSYVDMCMQTGASSYAWVNIVQNVWN